MTGLLLDVDRAQDEIGNEQNECRSECMVKWRGRPACFRTPRMARVGRETVVCT